MSPPLFFSFSLLLFFAVSLPLVFSSTETFMQHPFPYPVPKSPFALKSSFAEISTRNSRSISSAPCSNWTSLLQSMSQSFVDCGVSVSRCAVLSLERDHSAPGEWVAVITNSENQSSKANMTADSFQVICDWFINSDYFLPSTTDGNSTNGAEFSTTIIYDELGVSTNLTHKNFRGNQSSELCSWNFNYFDFLASELDWRVENNTLTELPSQSSIFSVTLKSTGPQGAIEITLLHTGVSLFSKGGNSKTSEFDLDTLYGEVAGEDGIYSTLAFGNFFGCNDCSGYLKVLTVFWQLGEKKFTITSQCEKCTPKRLLSLINKIEALANTITWPEEKDSLSFSLIGFIVCGAIFVVVVLMIIALLCCTCKLSSTKEPQENNVLVDGSMSSEYMSPKVIEEKLRKSDDRHEHRNQDNDHEDHEEHGVFPGCGSIEGFPGLKTWKIVYEEPEQENENGNEVKEEMVPPKAQLRQRTSVGDSIGTKE
eukprot:TRINITY_DN10544_c1_g1_i2.p1 TRINITY_DN10544_c1_g1~~TRINITY_DN10544_c1_g1_i2.p1  ORF type:complete len:481 (+),score=116.43 TRINITY_DN10544_c1_g1_i2:196-1638(+)